MIAPIIEDTKSGAAFNPALFINDSLLVLCYMV